MFKYVNPPAQPVKRKRVYREGTILSTIIVTAEKGFNIGGRHKFNAKTKNIPNVGTVVEFQYCKPCSKARSFLNIKGEEVEYVQVALNSQLVPSVEDYLKQKTYFNNKFKDLVISTYKSILAKNS